MRVSVGHDELHTARSKPAPSYARKQLSAAWPQVMRSQTAPPPHPMRAMVRRTPQFMRMGRPSQYSLSAESATVRYGALIHQKLLRSRRPNLCVNQYAASPQDMRGATASRPKICASLGAFSPRLMRSRQAFSANPAVDRDQHLQPTEGQAPSVSRRVLLEQGQ